MIYWPISDACMAAAAAYYRKKSGGYWKVVRPGSRWLGRKAVLRWVSA